MLVNQGVLTLKTILVLSILNKKNQDGHVLAADGHPEMAGLENLVEELIRNPYEFRLRTQFPTGVVFISDKGAGLSHEGLCAACAAVSYPSLSFLKGSSQGFVMTA